MTSDGRKSASIKFGTPGPAFENGLFGINAEITRKGYIGGISAQLLNNRKLFSGADSPAGWECENCEYVKDRPEESLCGSNFVVLRDGWIKQRSDIISLKKGRKYIAEAWVKAIDGDAEISFGVECESADRKCCDTESAPAEGCPDTLPFRSFPLNPSDEPYTKLAFEFSGQDIDNGLFSLCVKGAAKVFELSLMDSDNYYGMRPEVVAALKYLRPTSVRFPGGCAADHFRWRESLKAPEFRKPVSDEEKGWFLFRDTFNQDCLDIGINEFMMLCKAIGAEPEYTVSLLLSDGSDAADVVEYCNGGPDTEYGAIRQSLGFDAFNVKLWYIGNEAYFFGKEYYNDGALAARRTNELCAAMKQADGSIATVIGLTWAEAFKKWNYDFVGAVDCDYDYVSYHNYIGILPDATQGENGMATAEMVEKLFSDGSDIGLDFYKDGLFPDCFDRIQVCADEWNYTWGRGSSNAMLLSNALQFHFLAKSSGKYHVRKAQFFMPVNEGMITVKGSGCKVESSGEMFRLMHGHAGGRIVNVECDNDDIDVLCTAHEDGYYISAVNRTGVPVDLSFESGTVSESVQIVTGNYSFADNDFEVLRETACGNSVTVRGHSVIYFNQGKCHHPGRKDTV